ncbi:MAG TPA: hypothetical protein PKA95_12700 [Thermomicrobiales bacterium]|nr:hypothetical protein [Thermomicrobiales bacterium]
MLEGCIWWRGRLFAAGDACREHGALGVGEVKGVGEGADRVRVGTPAMAALERADRLDAETGSLGELLLRQPSRLAQLAETMAELARLRAIHAGHLWVITPAARATS